MAESIREKIESEIEKAAPLIESNRRYKKALERIRDSAYVLTHQEIRQLAVDALAEAKPKE